MPIIKQKEKSVGRINKIANNIQKLLNFSYMNTHYNNTGDRDSANKTINGINGAINDILQSNVSSTGVSSLATLYSTISASIDKDHETIEKNIKALFEKDSNVENLISIYSENKYIKDMDDEIDTICRYMPQLEEALDILKENVLSSEQFDKEFIYINDVSGLDNSDFVDNIDRIKDIYELEDKIDEIYYNVSKYGEEFYYIKRYSKEFAEILNTMKSSQGDPTKSCKFTFRENSLICENGDVESIDMNLDEEIVKEIESFGDIHITMESDMFIHESVKSKSIFDEVMKKGKTLEDMYNDSNSNLTPDSKFVGNDGVLTDKDIKENDIKLSGSIIKRLEHEKVVPLYMGENNFGYLYVNCDNSVLSTLSKSASDPTINIKRTTTMAELQNQSTNRDMAIMQLSSYIVKAIDINFINTHVDFKKDIYNILKYNIDHNQNGLNNIKITYIPPENVYHFYFKKDPKTHRGISDLQKSIIPAKLYTSLYITNTIGVITRGQDKRAFYVKQAIDTNIASILLNTINQIKKGNFGMRDINNLTNFINVTGRFNDFIIPEGNEPPIRMEVIQGQDIQIKTELMEMLENMALAPTGVPLEAVQSRLNQVDFATVVVSNNGKLLRKAYNRQNKTEKMLNPFLSLLYNNEYNTNDKIEMTLPPPKYLNNQQSDLMIENVLNTKEKYIELMYGSSRDSVDPLEIDLYVQNILRTEYSGIIPWDRLDRAKKRAQVQFNALKKKDDTE